MTRTGWEASSTMGYGNQSTEATRDSAGGPSILFLEACTAMDDRTLAGLEFAGILDALQEVALTPLGKERVSTIGPLGDLQRVEEALAEAREARDLLLQGEEPPYGGVTDIRPHLRHAGIEGASLDPRALRQIHETLMAARRLRTFFHRERDGAPLLWKRASGLVFPEDLCTAIGEAITPEGEVADAANPELRTVRHELRVQRTAIMGKLERYLVSPAYQEALAEPIITVRNHRYVIPVKAGAKAKIRGIVQDQSGSGLTIFLEPSPVVEMNNRLRMLHRQEEEVVTKILRSLTMRVRQEARTLWAVMELLGELDALTAKGRLAVRLRAEVPLVTQDGRLILRQARHPFLVLGPVDPGGSREEVRGDSRGAVPIDIEVGGTFAVLVVTGPNTGGKTVALKTAGLLTLMTLSGLPIPASPDSQVPCYRAVFADIGDEQSIAQSLSTFSSHMSQVVKILDNAGPETLVLLDELGAGTDPSEGAALGISILEALKERGASVIASTHLDAVKSFAAATPGVENASVEFDVQRLTPEYHVRLGLPGRSYGLEIAGRLGLPRHVLDKARAFLPEGHRRTQTLVETLERDRRSLARLKARLEDELRWASTVRTEAEQLVVRLRAGVKDLKRRVREEAGQLLAELREQGEGLIRALREQGGSRQEIRAFRQGFEDLRATVQASEAAQVDGSSVGGEIGPGQWVTVAGLGRQGRVLTTVSQQGTVEVELNVGRVHVPVSTLSPATAPEKPRGDVPLFIDKSESISTEINLVGCSVEESTRRLEKFLDATFVEGLGRVRVIHGKGTGTLRRAVHTFLSEHPLVEGFHLAGMDEGGSGATVVALRER